MEIIEYNEKYENSVKKLLKELQQYIVALDPYHFNIIKDKYEDEVFINDMKKVKDNNGKIFLAIDSSEVVGLIIGVIRKPIIEFDYERLNNMGEVIELIVTKNIRSKGVGNSLLYKMEDYFKSQNCKTINIDVFGYNDLAQGFYLKNGYHNRMLTMSKKID